MKNLIKLFLTIFFIISLSGCFKRVAICPTYDHLFYAEQSKKQLQIKSNYSCDQVYYYPERPKKRYAHERKSKETGGY